MGACTVPGNYMIITELMPRGDLDSLLRNNKIQLSPLMRMKMAKDAALGMTWFIFFPPPYSLSFLPSFSPSFSPFFFLFFPFFFNLFLFLFLFLIYYYYLFIYFYYLKLNSLNIFKLN